MKAIGDDIVRQNMKRIKTIGAISRQLVGVVKEDRSM